MIDRFVYIHCYLSYLSLTFTVYFAKKNICKKVNKTSIHYIYLYNKTNNQRSERPVRCESLVLKNNSQLTGLIQNKTKYCKIKVFLQNPQCILVQPLELFSARMYG